MDLVQRDQLWELSPVPQVIMDQSKILDANAAFWKLLGYEPDSLVNMEDWDDKIFPAKDKLKFYRFLLEGRRPSIELSLHTFRGYVKHIRVEKSRTNEGLYIVSFVDLTTVMEDAQVLQAGYDEFIKVTTELEAAQKAIQEKNAQLEKQQQILEQEMMIAHTVQSQVFEQDFSRFVLVNAAGFYETMDDLGGDMWDLHETPTDFLAVLGDVMGHGVAASLISIAAKTLFNTRFVDENASKDVADITNRMNREMLDLTMGNYYITAGLMRIDKSYTMQYITAGHPPLFLVRANGATEQLYTPQPMLGIFSKDDYFATSVQLEPGDRLLVYTDCLLETINEKGESLQIEDLEPTIRDSSLSPAEIVDAIVKYRADFAARRELPDDLAILCVEIPRTDDSRV